MRRQIGEWYVASDEVMKHAFGEGWESQTMGECFKQFKANHPRTLRRLRTKFEREQGVTLASEENLPVQWLLDALEGLFG
jgi:hypothetical protein